MPNQIPAPTLTEAWRRCLAFLADHGITLESKRLLLAVSGGMDSMFLMRMVQSAGLNIGVAHVNYGLRGTDSDADARLVRESCAAFDVPYFEYQIDLQARLQKQGGNLQSLARTLRYAWFEELMDREQFDGCLTAHHHDDSLETLFMNLLRGTGFAGLAGVPVVRDRIIRPLLCYSRREIRQLVEGHQISYREDRTNAQDTYLRNRVRKFLMPAWLEEDPMFIEHAKSSLERLRAEYAYFSECLEAACHAVAYPDSAGVLHIPRARLMASAAPEVLLYALLRQHGFQYHQAQEIVRHSGISGVRFLSESHEVILNRDEFLLVQIQADEGHVPLSGTVNEVIRCDQGQLLISETHEMSRTADPNIEFVDADTTGRDFLLRKWQPGDAFYPLGGFGRQKLQDFFTNARLSLPEKANTWLLISRGEIVWVCGMRLDHRFRVTDNTRQILRLLWTPEH